MTAGPVSDPLVSVVIPVYNSEDSIARAVRSVLGQTVRNIEILVVDDGSTDGTLAALTQLADNRISVLHCDKNTGAAAARNRGISAAMGEFVAFLDSDDYWSTDKLERQLAGFATSPANVHVICSSFNALHTTSGRVVERSLVNGRDWRQQMLDVCAVAPGSTLLARRRIFSEIGLQETSLRQFEDWDWLLRYLEKYPLIVMQESLATISMHGSPAPDSVKQQAARLYELRRQSVARQFGKPGLNRFHASMHLEYAVACVRAGKALPAAWAVMRAALLSPARVFDLSRRTAAKILRKDY